MLSRLFVRSSSDEGKKFDGTATLQQVAMSLNFFSFDTDASDISAREPFVLDNFFLAFEVGAVFVAPHFVPNLQMGPIR